MSKQPHKDKAVVSVPMPKKMRAALQKIADQQTGGDLGKLIREITAKEHQLNPEWKDYDNR